MPPRLIVHAGFHKTGTTTAQRAITMNRGRLSRVLRLYLKQDMPALCEAARTYSASGSDVDLALFAYEAAQIFEAVELNDPRPLLISSEDLSGHIPGRRRRKDYAAAPALMRRLFDTAGDVWGRAPEIVFYFSTRAPDAWVKSCHAQHVRATRMRQSLEEYAAWQLPHADLDAMVARIADAVAPARVHSAALETMTGPLGPLDPLLDLARISPRLRAKLRPAPPRNTAMPPKVLEELLALNRSGLDEDEMLGRKRALVAAVRAR